MANVDAPRGFILLQSEGKSYRTKTYIKDTAEAIFKGDLVRLAADGEVEPYDNGDAKCLGVAMENAAAAATEVVVCDDPDALFIAQCDGSFALADVGLNADVLATNGSVYSAHEVQSSSLAVTSTLPIKVLGLHSKGNNAVGTNAVVICKMNNTVLGGDGSTGL
jgi:hypothetical protein